MKIDWKEEVYIGCGVFVKKWMLPVMLGIETALFILMVTYAIKGDLFKALLVLL